MSRSAPPVDDQDQTPGPPPYSNTNSASKTHLTPENELRFRPLIDALQSQLMKGIEKTGWSQVRQLLARRDKAYLGKNGVPDSFAVYMRLAEKQNIITMQLLPDGKKADTISLVHSLRS